MQIVINIPEEVKRAFECAESNDLKGCYYDHGGVIGNAIKNGTPLSNNATNGDVIKAMFSNDSRDFLIVNMDKNSWWNAPYKADKESGK